MFKGCEDVVGGKEGGGRIGGKVGVETVCSIV